MRSFFTSEYLSNKIINAVKQLDIHFLIYTGFGILLQKSDLCENNLFGVNK